MSYIHKLPVSKYEKTRAIGVRAEQIAAGSEPLIIVEEMSIEDRRNPLKIAEKEYREGKMPLSIVRTYMNGQKVIVRFS